MTELDHASLEAALTSQAQLCAADEDPVAAMPRALTWLKLVWDAGDDHLPLLLVHDLGHLLLRGHAFRFASGRLLHTWSDDVRSARLAYEDRVVGSWSLDPGVMRLHVAVAGMARTLQDQAIAHAISLALGADLREHPELLHGNPAHLRTQRLRLQQALTSPLEEGVSDAWQSWALLQLRQLVEHLATRGRLFSEEDLWEVEHLEQLPSDSARLALRQLHAVASRIGGLGTGSVLTVRQAARQVPVDAEEAGAYPTGGFDAVSTRGRFENLVRTEISYVGVGAEQLDGFDLFDLRFIEGELLYYTRDQSPMLDQVRTLSVVLHRPAELRTKHRELPSQTLVLVTALARILQTDLVDTFGPAASRTQIVWCTGSDEDREAAEEEQRCLSHSLSAEVAHNRVRLRTIDSLEEVSPRGRVVFSPRAPTGSVEGLWCRVGEPTWSCLDGRAAPWSVDASRYEALRAFATEILLNHLG